MGTSLIFFKKPKVEIPKGFRLIKIPKDLNDISIAKLRTLHADIFGKKPKHDSAHGKQWIANNGKILKEFINQNNDKLKELEG